ncbi:MAG: leucine-rich repeat protein [Ruminococcus sp.]
MKKTGFLSLFLAVLLMFCSIFSAVSSVSAQGNTYGNFTIKVLGDNTAQITGYKGKDSNVKIPKTLGEYKVSSIGDNLFKGHSELKDVTIPDTVKSIGDYAFDCCTGLAQVTVPDSVTEIGTGAFFSCSRLKTATLSNNLKTIGDGAFFDCIVLQDISLSNTVTSVGEFAFGNCKKLQSVTLSNSLTEISNQMFLNCESLKTVTIPNTVKTIGRKAFRGCTALTSVTIPDTVTTIKEYAFYYCGKLKSIATNAQEIHKQAFAYCSNLKSITFTDNLKSIAQKAFEGCANETLNIPSGVSKIEDGAFASSNLKAINVDESNKSYTSVDGIIYNKAMTKLVAYPSNKDDTDTFTIPTTVTTVAPYSFSNCYALKSVILSENTKKIGDNAFENASSLESIKIPSSVTSLGESAFLNCSCLTSVDISANIKTIPNSAFSGCGELKSVYIGDNITEIGKLAFLECYSLADFQIAPSIKNVSATAFASTSIESFTVSEENTSLKAVDGVLFTKDEKTLVAYPPCKGGSAYTVPDKTEKINEYAIAYTNELTTVTVPQSVSYIGKNALGYIKAFSSDTYDRAPEFMILGKDNSYAEKYATDNDLAFFTEMPSLKEKGVTLNSGSTYTFTVKGADDNIEYSSSDESIATVDSKGKITGVSKGETVVVASTGTVYLKCRVKVANGKANPTAKSKYYSKFTELTIKNYESWEKSYYKLNKDISFSQLDNPNIKCYTSNEFIPIVGAQEGGGALLEATKESYGEDYGQYKIIGDNLATELGKFKNEKDLVLFSGTEDVSLMTGKTSSVKDMMNSVGNRYTTKSVVSTSIDHTVGTHFGDGSYHTMLEIYAPATEVKGGYIKKISVNPQEYEILLDKGLEYEVLEAGVREVPVTDFNNGEKSVVTERYMKVKIVGGENPNTDPTTPSSTQPTTSGGKDDPTNPTNPSKENKENGSVPTGDTTFVPTVVFATASLMSLVVFLCLRKKKED